MTTIDQTEARLTMHEAVCAERWKETILRIKRIESTMIGAAAAIIVLLSSIVMRMN